jgi:guanylate kinase
MSHEGIIITGTSCSGKSSIANLLCKQKNANTPSCFKLVRAITTRERREDDDSNYKYVSEIDFKGMIKNKKLMISIMSPLSQ